MPGLPGDRGRRDCGRPGCAAAPRTAAGHRAAGAAAAGRTGCAGRRRRRRGPGARSDRRRPRAAPGAFAGPSAPRARPPRGRRPASASPRSGSISATVMPFRSRPFSTRWILPLVFSRSNAMRVSPTTITPCSTNWPVHHGPTAAAVGGPGAASGVNRGRAAGLRIRLLGRRRDQRGQQLRFDGRAPSPRRSLRGIAGRRRCRTRSRTRSPPAARARQRRAPARGDCAGDRGISRPRERVAGHVELHEHLRLRARPGLERRRHLACGP